MDAARDDPVVLPEHIKRAFVRILADVRDDFVFALLKERPEDFPGFRPKKANVKPVRKLIEREILAARTLSGHWISLLRTARTAADLVNPMDACWVREHMEELAGGAVPGEFVAGLLLSERTDIEAIGRDYLDRWTGDGDAPDSGSEALSAAYKLVLPYVEASWRLYGSRINCSPPGDDGAKPQQSSGALEDADRRLQELRNKLEREQDRGRAAVSERDRKIETLKAALDGLRRDVSLLKAENRRLAQEMEHSAKAAEGAAAAMVEAALHETIRPWYEPVHRTDETAKSLSKDLVERATGLLALQSSRDKHYGNRQVVMGRIRECETLLQQVETARATALAPLPELALMSEELAAEIRRLRVRLGERERVAGQLDGLLTVLNTAADLGHVAKLRAWADQSRELGVFSDGDFAIVAEALHRKVSELSDRAVIVRRAPLMTPLQRFLAAFGDVNSKQTVLYVDGHNVLFVMAQCFGPYLDRRGTPKHEARDVLRQRLQKAFGSEHTVMVRLYFDAPTASEDVLNERFRVLYAGGQGADRADRAILRDLGYRSPVDEVALRVVTRDLALARAAHDLRALRVDPQELLPFLFEAQ